jgi:hypothetical protein
VHYDSLYPAPVHELYPPVVQDNVPFHEQPLGSCHRFSEKVRHTTKFHRDMCCESFLRCERYTFTLPLLPRYHCYQVTTAHMHALVIRCLVHTVMTLLKVGTCVRSSARWIMSMSRPPTLRARRVSSVSVFVGLDSDRKRSGRRCSVPPSVRSHSKEPLS